MPGIGDFLGNIFRPQQVQQPGQAFADPMAGMGAMDRLGYMRQNNPEALMALAGGLMAGNPGAGFAAAGQEMGQHRKMFAEQQKADRQENMTKRWLMSNKGMSYEEATMAMSNPAILTQVLKTGAGGDPVEYSKVPIYGTDEQGNTVLGTIGGDGTFKKIDTGGFNVAAGVDKIDLGTRWMLRDKRTGEVVGYEPKDLRGAEAEKAIGEGQGKAAAAAGGDVQAGQNALDLIGDLRTDPNRQRGTGVSSVLNAIPGTAGYDFSTKVEQAKSGAFLSAIQQLRGMGALSNTEGATATAAVTRMNTSTSEGAFLEALDDYEKIVKQGVERAKRTGSKFGIDMPPAQGGVGNRTSSGVTWTIEGQ
jgi:hypothetical protein